MVKCRLKIISDGIFIWGESEVASVFLEGEAVEVGNIFCIGRNYAAHIEELKNEIPYEAVRQHFEQRRYNLAARVQ